MVHEYCYTHNTGEAFTAIMLRYVILLNIHKGIVQVRYYMLLYFDLDC